MISVMIVSPILQETLILAIAKLFNITTLILRLRLPSPPKRGRPPSSSQLTNIGFNVHAFFIMITSKLNMAFVYFSDLECPKSKY